MTPNNEKVLSIIEEAEKNGDVYHTLDAIVARAQGCYPELTRDEVCLALAHLSADGVLVHDRDTYAITDTRYAEDKAAGKIAQIIRANDAPEIDAAQAVAKAEQGLGFALSSGQRTAVEGALRHRLSIITGGPGTGKTTVLRALCDAFDASGSGGICLMAPTGKAARHLAEQTGRPAATIHSVLLSLEREERALSAGLAVVDEASMLSIPLLWRLLAAIPPQTLLVLVGDPDQLPAVGPGQVLRDLLGSGLPVFRLRDNFRQSEQGAICQNLARIRERHTDLVLNRSDFVFLETGSAEDTEQLALSIYLADRAQHGNGAQLLTPIGPAGGVCSAKRFNDLAQAQLNPPSPEKVELKIGDTVFRIGDRVLQTRNNSQARNGDVGTIIGICADSETTVAVRFDFMEDDAVYYSLNQLKGGLLQLAYALTIHKAQGSEYDYVVIPLAKEHLFNWTNNMIYTAVSRAKKRVILVGSRWLLERAIRTPLPPCRSELAAKISRCLSPAA